MPNSPFGFDEPEHSPGFMLWQTTTSWQRMIKKALEPHQISHAQFVILAILMFSQNQSTQMTQVDIGQASKLDKMTISKSLKKLVSLKLVERHEHANDSRAKAVTLTTSGVNLTKKLVPIIESVDAHFFGQLSKKQETILIELLGTLVKTTN